ncbi:BTB/POZ domain-containing protein At5g66560-like [Zingiber officinale]|uniref:BTB/POZ domain-containing protein At5g66560-like n=1 Tax=Zingiber officinale TaxID=94328 RepID=UPI001C4C6679|nr:BTB/POZ domain-containing protein At5g66560-like [Zingiber officinale]
MSSRSRGLVRRKEPAMAKEEPCSKGQAWFCFTTGLPSDIAIEVDGMSFHLHKFPLMARSGRIQRLITEMEENPKTALRRRRKERVEAGEPQEGDDGADIEEIEKEEEEMEEAAYRHIALADFPANCEAFETAAKFCYGVKIDLSPWNVAPVRCAAEYLEMTEDLFEDNLVARTERFLAQTVLPSIRQSIQTLKSCEDLLPLADNLSITQRCIDAIAACASAADPNSLFGWLANEGHRGGSGSGEQILWNGIETGLLRRRNGVRSSSFAAGAGSWLEDLAILSLPMYKRVIAAMKARELNSDAIEGSLISYAQQSIPGLSRSRRKHSSAPVASETEQRELLETVIANLPAGKNSAVVASSSTATKFLFGLLRTAHILRASEAARTALERKIALQLERATLDNLLIPSYSYHAETLYDVDCVERILGYYLAGTEAEQAPPFREEGQEVERAAAVVAGTPSSTGSLQSVGKLVDAYLAEIASDANLKVDKFYGLAVALPDEARVYHDGLYRAVDIYLKTHPRMNEEEKERLCGVMDCRKLTLEACTHAAQNERLPLRAVVQVLFFEQLQLRRVIAGTLLVAEEETTEPSAAVAGNRGTGEEGGAWRAAMRENQVLRLDMDSMRNRVQELERECSSMKKALAKLEEGGEGLAAVDEGEERERRRHRPDRSRFRFRFSTQVCDSREGNVVESRQAARRELSP